jgi:hypothetical protein
MPELVRCAHNLSRASRSCDWNKGFLSPAVGISRLSSGKPEKKYPENPVDPVK